ncbi:MAG TPA: type II secretion system protein E [Thermomicrobiales bacterium]|nr:type II secretion system protein E [Thermomicrobiales bacterium]
MTSGPNANSVNQAQATGAVSGYAEPFGWWGYHWTPPEPRSLLWLIERGALDVRLAAFLSLTIEAKASFIVVAEPHEAGKTTLLTALLDFLPALTQPVYLRGWYERFSFLDTLPPDAAYLLCNEISSHLPTYLWGHGVRRVFEAANAGYPLATTMHATGAADALDQLASYPLDVPREHLPSIDLVITIGVGYASNKFLRRVARVERITAAEDGPSIRAIATREPLRAELDYQIGRLIGTLATLTDASDDQAAAHLAQRVRTLEQWLTAGLATTPSLRETIVAARERSTGY